MGQYKLESCFFCKNDVFVVFTLRGDIGKEYFLSIIF